MVHESSGSNSVTWKLQVRSPRLSSVRLMIWALLMMNCFWIAILRKGKVMPRGCYSHKAARKLVLRRQEGRMLGSPIRYCSIEACCSGKA
ncbi:uncharacterized protein [Lolium perenne]|uniref:uncharacterized protein isoform X2 n=1 Tax=Lolium perenne TaxID=4522 RepID=UPI003A9A2A80